MRSQRIPLSPRLHAAWALAAALALVGCASVPDLPATATAPEWSPPPAWQAPLPHQGQVKSLAQWWAQWHDPALLELVERGQTHSATVAAAVSRMSAARAAAIDARAGALPAVNATATAYRSVLFPGVAPATMVQQTLQASWELDVFGRLGAGRDAAAVRYEGAQALWHDARVSVAAEVALQYFNLRLCESQRALSERDLGSRERSAQMALASAQAGLGAPSAASLAQAGAADAANALSAKRAECEGLVKGLVTLTALPEAALRERLTQVKFDVDTSTLNFQIARLPAEVLAQRPDMVAAQRNVLAAQADLASAKVARWPTISFTGYVGPASRSTLGTTASGSYWSFGPVSVTLPLLDQGRISARQDAALAAYQEAVVAAQARARGAVQEVEQALVNLQSTDERARHAQDAARHYTQALVGVEARHRVGLASGPELEDMRRTAWTSDLTLLALKRDRIVAWISLYRAAGGGWPQGDTDATPSARSASPDSLAASATLSK